MTTYSLLSNVPQRLPNGAYARGYRYAYMGLSKTRAQQLQASSPRKLLMVPSSSASQYL